MYVNGSFAYEYLEDDDPWTHAREMKYVAFEKKLDVPYFRPVSYLDPYPPAYSMIMGILHQTSPEAQWTLKFFNSLLISLSVVFFFFMVKTLTRRSNLAITSTFILSMLPSYLSHFIWAHTLIPLLFFLLIYSFVKIDQQARWWIVAMVVSASIFLTHTFQAIKLMILAFGFFAVKWIYFKKFPKKIFYAVISGFLISLSWWIFKFKGLMQLYITEEKVSSASIVSTGVMGIVEKVIKYLPRLLSPEGGTATRAYSIPDFFIAQKTNMINAPIGWGFIITLLLIFAIVMIFFNYKKLIEQQHYWVTILLVWFVLTFLGINSDTFNLPIGMAGFRIWMLLAIPVSILSAKGLLMLIKASKEAKYVVLIILVIAIIITSGYPKYEHNTNPNWPVGAKWTYIQENGRIYSPELEGYIWIKNNMPINTRIFSYWHHTNMLYGMNMFPCTWCEEFREFKKDILFKDALKVHSWLVNNDYEYLVFGSLEYKYFGRDYGQKEANTLLNQRISEMVNMPTKFQIVYQNKGMILLKVLR